MRRALTLLLCLLLAACAGYSGAGLQPGTATESEVRQTMGVPAMQWDLPGGGRQLAYPRGPGGFETFMVYTDAAGRLQRIVNVLDMENFARIQPGMSQAEVLQIIGPPQPHWEAYFKARDELVWEWRYCDSWREAARFDVLFDGTTKLVRSTLTWTESMKSNWRISC